MADLGRDHVFYAAFFSGPIKHLTEKSGLQGARKTGYFPLFKKKQHYKLKNVFLDLSKILQPFEEAFPTQVTALEILHEHSTNARFDPVLALLSSTVTYMRLSLQKHALSHQVLLLRTVMFETITYKFYSCLIDQFYRFVLSSVKGFLIHRKHFFLRCLNYPLINVECRK